MLPTRLLVRVAGRLDSVWRSRAQQATRDDFRWLERLRDRLESLQDALNRLEKARVHGLQLVLPSIRQEVLDHLEGLQPASRVARDAVDSSEAAGPGLAMFMAELRQVEDESNEFRVDCKQKAIIVATAPITLREVYLGPFAIQFHWERVLYRADDSCFDIVALDPHPAAANELVTHPHVKDRSLCAGDASVPIRKALEQGRLADAFCLVRSVLNHYNPSSPHVPLDDWADTDSTACYDCGRNVGEDDRCYCEGCGCDFCQECIGSCAGCDEYRCYACMKRCAACEEYCCARCLTACTDSCAVCCRHCRDSCARCGSTVARDDLDEACLCPSCQSKPPQPEPIPETKHDPDPEPVRPASA